MPEVVYTVGHSTHSLEKFLELLKQHSITAVCDVRSKPYSRINPQFSRETLKQSLREGGVAYVFLGKELGARSEDRSCYRNGQVQYDLLAQTDLFRSGLKRVREGAQKYRVALMCAEKDPLHCHRTILVARRLVEHGVQVLHILSDGKIEEHERSLERLIETLKLPQNDMFCTKADLVAEAYHVQGNAIAYHEKEPDVQSARPVALAEGRPSP